MQFKANIAQARPHQPVMHHRQRRHLLGHEQHRPAIMRRRRDQVGDGLALPRSGRPLHHKASTTADLFDYLGLAGVRVDHLDDLRRVQNVVQLVVWTKDRRVFLEPLGQQPAKKIAFRKGIHRPSARVQIAVHQQLGKGEEPNLHPVAVDRPSGFARDHILKLGEIV